MPDKEIRTLKEYATAPSERHPDEAPTLWVHAEDVADLLERWVRLEQMTQQTPLVVRRDSEALLRALGCLAEPGEEQ